MADGEARAGGGLAGFRERAAAFARGDAGVVAKPPRPASTVILLRDGAAGVETFIMRRVRSMAFAPGMHVFPGGRVDAGDTDGVLLTGDPAAIDVLAARASTDVPGLVALYSCAVRETLEETGVVLVEPDVDGVLRVDPAELPIVGHWVTPEIEDHRYDVRFFAAVVRPEHDPLLTTTEGDQAAWIAPEVALEQFAAGSMAMLPPTVAMLRLLLGYPSASAALAAAGLREVLPVLPRPFIDPAGEVRWSLVNDRTGEVILPDVSAPQPRETAGIFDIPVEASEQ